MNQNHHIDSTLKPQPSYVYNGKNEYLSNVLTKLRMLATSKGVICMVGVEFDMVVKDSLKALELYEKIFDIKRVEVTDFPKGQNEVVFTLYGVRFHMLDENPEFNLIAPTPEDPKTFWFNIAVPDIEATYKKAIDAGCKEIQPVTEMPDFGVSNAIFMDPFNYIWMLHQIHRKVSFEERVNLLEEKSRRSNL